MADLAEGESITYAPEVIPSRAPDLRLLHYNDVYHVDAASAEPVGGIARFMTVVNYYRNDAKFQDQPRLLTLFSGDAFNPSLESSVTKGSHMVPILNNIGTNVACVGNHDLDFGVKQYRHLTSQCKFPWLVSNILDPALGEDVPIGNAQRTTILESSNNLKVGVIGIGEREWLATINALPPNLDYRSATETARQLVPDIKGQGADLIIALAHQREPNDNKLANNVGQGVLDLILGGHDHHYAHSVQNGVHVLRSGTDFKQLSYIECWRKSNPSEGWNFRITRRDIISSIKEDEQTLRQVDNLTKALKARLSKPIGYTMAPLDARFVTVRTKESNIGNFVCDLMCYYYDCEACIMASGTIRGDQIYPPGVLKLKDLMNCFPFEDPVVVIKVSGKALLDALENSVCLYPALEGRFPQVSNIIFTFDPSKPAHSRVDRANVMVAGKPIELDRIYKLCTRGYMARGKDGYESLLVQSEGGEAEEVVNEENGVLISTILRQYFMSLKVIGKWKMWGVSMEKHWNTVNQGLSHSSCSTIEPRSSEGNLEKGTSKHGEDTADRQMSSGESSSDSDGYDSESGSEEISGSFHESAAVVASGLGDISSRQRIVAQKVIRKWRRLTGLQGEPAVCDTQAAEEFQARWTKAIAPRVEGRINIVST